MKINKLGALITVLTESSVPHFVFVFRDCMLCNSLGYCSCFFLNLIIAARKNEHNVGGGCFHASSWLDEEIRCMFSRWGTGFVKLASQYNSAGHTLRLVKISSQQLGTCVAVFCVHISNVTLHCLLARRQAFTWPTANDLVFQSQSLDHSFG